MTGSPARRAIATIPFTSRPAWQNVQDPSFHILRLPSGAQGSNRLKSLVVEYGIESLATTNRQAIWWTSYVVVARPGILNIRESGVYAEWDEFANILPYPGTISPQTGDIDIVDIEKGVLNNGLSGTVLRQVDMSGTSIEVEIYAVLVASARHDPAYQVSAQARLEFESNVPTSFIGKVVAIANVKTGALLTMPSSDNNAIANQGNLNNPESNQKWTVECLLPEGKYTFKLHSNNTYLSYRGSSPSEGTRVALFGYHVFWHLRPQATPGVFKIVSWDNDKFKVDLTGGNPANGSLVNLSAARDDDSMDWKLVVLS